MPRRSAPNPREIMSVMALVVLVDSTATTHRRRFVAEGFVVPPIMTGSSTFAVGRTGQMASNGECRCPSPALHQHQEQQRMIDSGADKAESYEATDLASKGLVSILTSLVNGIMERLPAQSQSADPSASPSLERLANPSSEMEDTRPLDNSSDGALTAGQPTNRPPQTPDELLERIRNDYIANNYLWTGNLDVSAFDPQCTFQDPTLSFRGTDRFVQNVQNLRPVVDAVVTSCRSDLLSIGLNGEDGYVQTRWNMVGDLGRLPWKPQINVVGRTKFWYRSTPLRLSTDETERGGKLDETTVVVVRYDEEWEIPAYRALLQIVTPGGDP